MFGIGTGELLVLLVLALLVLGPERMPGLARDIGKTVGDLRRTSDELKQEFMSADALINKAASIGEPIAAPATSPVELAATPSSAPAAEVELPGLPGGAAEAAPGTGVTETGASAPAVESETVAAVDTDPDETAFDKEARLARERLDDPARAERAKAEGWSTPTDEAGTNTDRWS